MLEKKIESPSSQQSEEENSAEKRINAMREEARSILENLKEKGDRPASWTPEDDERFIAECAEKMDKIYKAFETLGMKRVDQEADVEEKE